MTRKTMALLTGLLVVTVGIGGGDAVAGPVGHGSGAGHALQFRVGGFYPSGGGDVWNDNEAFYTMDVDDFNDTIFGVTFVGSAVPWMQFGINADYYDASTLSTERDVVDEFGFPIVHDTRLTLMPITADVRFVPGGEQARRTGRPFFYFGAGLGLTFWEYEESGEFVDFGAPGLPIYAGSFGEDGVALETHVLGGLEIPVGRQVGLLFESRYSWADDDLDSGDFPGFGRLNLGGPSVYAGASFRF